MAHRYLRSAGASSRGWDIICQRLAGCRESRRDVLLDEDQGRVYRKENFLLLLELGEPVLQRRRIKDNVQRPRLDPTH